tara:strand:+ start:499 stop:867 length:369 start_codon:yes stop_codon:yes gene_type:complete
MELIKAMVLSVNVKNSKNGNPGLSVALLHDDNGDKQRIWHWLWREGNNVDKNLLDWAAIADPENKAPNAVDAVLSGKLSDLVVDLIVEKNTGNDFWDIKSVGLLGTLEIPVETVPDDDDIPF